MSKTNKKVFFFLSILLLCVLIVGTIFADGAESRKNTGYKYILGEYGGYMALYDANSDEPLSVYDVKISSLPGKDRDELSDGIRVSDDNALIALIEDYTS